MDVEITDGVDRHGRQLLLHSGRTLRIAEYLISMRPGWLCYRYGHSVIIEGYKPNRVARQFGFSQATAYDKRPSIPGIVDARQTSAVPEETKFHAASILWLHLLRLGTGSRFRIAAPDSYTGVSYTHLTWVRLSFASAMERGARRYERRVLLFGITRGLRQQHSTARANDDRGMFFQFSLIFSIDFTLDLCFFPLD